MVFTEALTVEPDAATRITVVLDPSTLTMRRMDQTGRSGEQKSEIHLEFAGGRIKGNAIVPMPQGVPRQFPIDTVMAPGPCYTEFAGHVIVRALPLRPGAVFSFPVFSVGDQTIKTLNVEATATDSVRVPAGAFRALRVAVSEGEVPRVFYVSEAAPRRIAQSRDCGVARHVRTVAVRYLFAGVAAAALARTEAAAQFPSTYARHPNPPVAITNATIMTAAGIEIAHGAIVLREGRIVAVGTDVAVPPDAIRVDGTGKYVTPGIIDTHCHLGVYAAPGTEAESDGNETTNPVTAEVWAEHSFWPQDPQIPARHRRRCHDDAGAAGLGKPDRRAQRDRSRLVPARTVQEMKFPGARYGLKMACGENPKRVYGSAISRPSTRMGNMAGTARHSSWRSSTAAAGTRGCKDRKGDPPERDLRIETLAGVLRGDIYVQNHCYRADEMAQMLDLATRFGFKIRVISSRDRGLQDAPICSPQAGTAAVDVGGLVRLQDGGVSTASSENAALLQQAGARASSTRHPDGIQRLNQDAAKAMYAGSARGSRSRAIRRCGGSPRIPRGCSASIGGPGRSSPARWPMSCSGQAIPSRCTRRR